MCNQDGNGLHLAAAGGPSGRSVHEARSWLRRGQHDRDDLASICSSDPEPSRACFLQCRLARTPVDLQPALEARNVRDEEPPGKWLARLLKFWYPVGEPGRPAVIHAHLHRRGLAELALEPFGGSGEGFSCMAAKACLESRRAAPRCDCFFASVIRRVRGFGE